EIIDIDKKIQSVANDLGYTDLDALTEDECKLIALVMVENNKNNGDLVIQESNTAPITKAKNINGGLKLLEYNPAKIKKAQNSNFKKPKTTQSQPNENPVNPNMKKVITGLVEGTEKLCETTHKFCEQLTADTSRRIIKRLTQVNSDILTSVTNELKTENLSVVSQSFSVPSTKPVITFFMLGFTGFALG
ncbi:MAG: hypothetical protein ACKPJO_26880, partial [Dolichospermum sp.]